MSQELEEYFLEWMKNFVEVPHPSLGGWAPCPYARKARIEERIKFVHHDLGKSALPRNLYVSLNSFEDHDIIVIFFDHTECSVEYIKKHVDVANRILMPEGYVVLEDHPDDPEYINGVKMNFRHSGLLFVQKLDKLQEASRHLENRGYYKTWSEENLKDVVNWREIQ